MKSNGEYGLSGHGEPDDDEPEVERCPECDREKPAAPTSEGVGEERYGWFDDYERRVSTEMVEQVRWWDWTCECGHHFECVSERIPGTVPMERTYPMGSQEASEAP